MKLKLKYAKKEDIPAGFEELYTEKEGAFTLTGVEGMKTQEDVDFVKTALQKERNDHKAIKDKFAVLVDKDLEDVIKKLDTYEELEIRAKGNKVSDEDIEKIVNTRINSIKGPLERERDKLRKDLGESTQAIEKFTTKERQRTVHDAVREAVTKQQGFATTAVEDAIVFGERMLEITEDGKVVTKDNVGVTPGVDATVWLSDMQQKKPHWFGPSQGGGSNGSGQINGSGTNPFSAKDWNLTAQGSLVKENPERATQMARAAGTTIGGLRPEIKNNG